VRDELVQVLGLGPGADELALRAADEVLSWARARLRIAKRIATVSPR
jgi:hypothetical protein